MGNALKIKKDSTFLFRINSKIKEAMNKTASKKGVTSTDYVSGLILDALKKEGVKIELTQTII